MYRIYTTPSDSRNPLFPSSLSSSLDPSLPKRPGRRRGRSLRWPALGAAAATLLLLHAPPSSRHKGGATAPPPPPGAAPVQRVAEAPRAVPRAGRPQRRRGASWPRRWPPALRRGAASSRRCVCSCYRRNPRRLASSSPARRRKLSSAVRFGRTSPLHPGFRSGGGSIRSSPSPRLSPTVYKPSHQVQVTLFDKFSNWQHIGSQAIGDLQVTQSMQ